MTVRIYPSTNFEAQGPHGQNVYDGPTIAFGESWVVGGQQGALLTYEEVIPERRSAEAGLVYTGVNDQLYHRILVEPAYTDVGNVVADIPGVIRVWNGFLNQVVYSSFSSTGADGIAIDRPVEPPTYLYALQEIAHPFVVGVNGPPTIDATFTWNIAGGSYSSNITGRRIVLFPFGPNWATPVTETISWMTDVMVSYSGKEQRRSLRTKARRTLSWRFHATGRFASDFDNLLWGWQNRRFAIPLWTDKSYLSTDAAAGVKTLAVSTELLQFRPGDLAVIVADPGSHEVVEVESVEADALHLLRELGSSWPAGTPVYPCVLGNMDTEVATSRLTSSAVIGDIEFLLDPLTTDPNTPDEPASDLFDGIPVITRQPNWVAPLNQSSNFRFKIRDNNTGPVELVTQDRNPALTRAYTWLLKDREMIAGYREMLGRCHGRLNPLWVPTWHEDFECIADIGASELAISMRQNGFQKFVGDNPDRNYIRFQLRDGTVYYRRVNGFSPIADGYQIIMDQSFGVDLTPADFHKISILAKSRLASDTITMSWRSNSVVTTDSPFTTLRGE